MIDGRRFGIAFGFCVIALATHASAQRAIFAWNADAPSGEAGPAWSLRQMGRTPGTPTRRFVGPFANERVSLSIGGIPARRVARVALKLYVVQSWDGSLFRGWNGSAFGPDFWAMDIVDADGTRRNLLRATFSDTALRDGFKAIGAIQSYPYPLSADRVSAGTGAAGRVAAGLLAAVEKARASSRLRRDMRYKIWCAALEHFQDRRSDLFLPSPCGRGWGRGRGTSATPSVIERRLTLAPLPNPLPQGGRGPQLATGLLKTL